MKKLAILLLLCSLSAAVALAADIVHVVKKGETLSAISHKYHVAVADILRHNGLKSAAGIKAGQKLKIPAPGGTKTAAAKPKPAPAVAVKPAPAAAKPDTALAPQTAEKMDTIMPEATLEKPDSQAQSVEPAKKQPRVSTKAKFFILVVVQTVISALLSYLIALWVVNRSGGYKRGA